MIQQIQISNPTHPWFCSNSKSAEENGDFCRELCLQSIIWSSMSSPFDSLWMKKSSSIGCSSGRANSSSFPVKYIPKKTLKKEKPEISKKTLKTEKPQTEKPQTSSTSKKAPENKVIKNGSDHNALRFEVHNDGKSLQRSFVLDKNSQNQNQNQMPIHYLTYHADQELKEETDYDEGVVDCESIEEPKEVVEELEIHWEKNPHYQEALQGVKTNKQDAEKLAIELLATRAFTAVELRKKLHGKRFPPDIIDAVIMDFQSRGLVNDCLYAETFSQSRFSSSSWGPRRIKQALFKKGVSEVDAEKAINLVFQDSDQESRHGLSKVSMDHLFVQASKQWLRGRDVTNETRKSRIVRWLQYRGFNWGVISSILKKLESENPP
ncbi:unnamed protein product [Camellia sinensis]